MEFIIPEKQYEIASEGQHVAVLAELIDLGVVAAGKYEPKDSVKLVFLVDQRDSKNQLIQVHVRCTKTRSQRGNLYPFVRALSYPAPLTRDSWDLSKHVGKCVMLDIVHNTRPDGRTYANVERPSILSKTSPRLTVPASYVPRGGQRNQKADDYFAAGAARDAETAKPAAIATQGKDVRLGAGFATGAPQEDDTDTYFLPT